MAFDPSTDYANYPTLAPLPTCTASEDAYIHCPICGGTAFHLRRTDGMPVCMRCEYTLESAGQPDIDDWTASDGQDLQSTVPEQEEKAPSRVISSIDAASASRFQIARGPKHTIVLRPDGTVKAVGENKNGQCNVQDWTNITSIVTSQFYTIGLCENGTVRVASNNFLLRSRFNNWKNITSIAAGGNFVVARCADGTVKSVGVRLPNWTGVAAISAYGQHIAAVCEDGTVRVVGINNHGMCNVKNWYGITNISLGSAHTVGLCQDGTVKAAGYSKRNKQVSVSRCAVENWSNIIAIAAGKDHTVALHQGGWVFVAGANTSGQCNVSDWSDVVAICAGENFTAGLRSDGTVLCTEPSILKLLGDIYN